MLELFVVNRDHAKYTLPSHALAVRSTSIDVLSWNFPSRLGAAAPFATMTLPLNALPSLIVFPFSPAGFSKRATHSSPNVFFVPAGSPDDSDAMNRRPWLSHAITGSPDPAVRTRASAAYGDVSPGYPGTSELWNDAPEFSER